MTRWRKFWSLSRSEQWLLVRAAGALALSVLALRVLGYRDCRRLLAALSPPVPTTGRDEEDRLAVARTAARMVQVVARHGPWRANCLPQALALCWLLRRRGILAELRIGVRKEAGRLEAHAWVEHAGWILNDRSEVEGRFAPFPSAVRLGFEKGS